MKCPKCQTDNPDTQKFCGECGTKLEIICSNCGCNNPPQYNFCGECGHNLILPSELAPKDLSLDEILKKLNLTSFMLLVNSHTIEKIRMQRVWLDKKVRKRQKTKARCWTG
ncbi:zinc ribbon domain-containing protein [candidate division KSB1 bacterium]|nr:zinc ribbon domain-containing protein [candidate division KSB1 bacterium]